ncbi:MAG: hypothetical protein HC838_16710 [Spirulinaceae cyanobacterium RM2_2_10]|nr:hypothetical protein [Spirulinaceae cyanobacterium SM2_1_0]NJO21344.1 hypothetical protein [Spirulinaceae cyanobacterium RM2_2_10]
MDPQRQQDFQRRLQELEAEVQQTETANRTNFEANQSRASAAWLQPALQRLWLQAMAWFDQLPTVGKVVAIIVAIILGLSLVNAVLNIVTTLIMLAIGLTALYLLYRLFLAKSTP